MASARSRLLNLFTRVIMWLIFRKHRPVTEFRPRMVKMDARRAKPPPQGITYEDGQEPVEGRWVRNAGAGSQKQMILYLHGGAYFLRLPHGHSAMVADICARAGVSAFMPWYRLAPEHPYPAAPNDCLEAYRRLLESGVRSADVVVMGDSAGGNLAFSLLHLIKRESLPMPAGVIGVSPITDCAQISGTWRLNKLRDPMYLVQAAVNPAEWYFKGVSPTEPVLSPYYGDFSGFPPMYFMVGALEALLEDSVGMARKAVDCGIPAKVQIWQGMPHCFPLHDVLPEAEHARKQMVDWVMELRKTRASVDRSQLYRSCVEVYNLRPWTGRIECETNDVYLTS